MDRTIGSRPPGAGRAASSTCTTNPIGRRAAGASAPARFITSPSRVENDEALFAQKALYEELGYTDASEVKDRFYFHSMYVRSPGGVLVECTANVPGGFYQDEEPEELGTRLNLPPWYESQRADILAMLEPVTVPEENRPVAEPGHLGAPRQSRPARR